MRIVRASEIGQFLYCQRAWWYAVIEEETVSSPFTDSGILHHQKKQRLLLFSNFFRIIAFILILAGVGFLLLHILSF